MSSTVVAQEIIEQKIYLIRGKKVMLDRDLAQLYEVETKQLKRAVRRSLRRFPEDLMFVLTMEESKASRRQIGTLKVGQNIKYLSYAFTEQGIATSGDTRLSYPGFDGRFN